LTSAVVIGAGVAGLGAAARLRRGGARVTLLEAGTRVGGLVESERSGGWVIEHGADGFLSSKSQIAQHLSWLGLDGRIVRGGSAPRRAYIASEHGLEPLPSSLFRFERGAVRELLGSRLLSPRAKLRLLLEPFISRATEEESVASFMGRRFGVEVAEHIVEPMLRGVFGSPTSALGMQGAMPKLADHERRYGSVGLALMLAPRSGEQGGLVTLSGGMQTLVDALAPEVAPSTYLSTPAQSIRRSPRGGLRVTTSRHGDIETDTVVLACPTWMAARLVARLDTTLADELAMIRASDVNVVSLGFHAADLPFITMRPKGDGDWAESMDGTGFLVDPALGRALVACTWASRKWHGRAPRGEVLVRCVVDAPAGCSEAELVELTRVELRHFVGIDAEPTLMRTKRRLRALPVYAPGHHAHVARARARARELGIELAGNGYDGIGVPDCLASGLRAAARALRDPAQETRP